MKKLFKTISEWIKNNWRNYMAAVNRKPDPNDEWGDKW